MVASVLVRTPPHHYLAFVVQSAMTVRGYILKPFGNVFALFFAFHVTDVAVSRLKLGCPLLQQQT